MPLLIGLGIHDFELADLLRRARSRTRPEQCRVLSAARLDTHPRAAPDTTPATWAAR